MLRGYTWVRSPAHLRRRLRMKAHERYPGKVPDVVARGFAWLLLFVHAGLGVWALAGFIELLDVLVPWPSVTNPELPRWLLWLRWPVIGAACVAFIVGYLRRSRHTPWVMLSIYSIMAAMCAYETFFVLTNASRYWAMAIEYAEYAAILLFLFRSNAMQQRFA